MSLDVILGGLAVANLLGVGGLWFKLGAALESNTNVHTRLDSLTTRVRQLELGQERAT